MQLQPNTKFDRYQLERLLGRGGFSEVWLAKDPFTGLEVAIKVYAPGQGMDDDGLAVFGRELANVYDMHHSNLLTPTHLDQWQGMPYLILPYCAKGSCFKYIGKLSEAQVWHLLYDVASGLAYLHEREIIHQDIKPDNILIDANDKFVITDFGISTKARSTLSKSVLNATGAGSTAYMGPERFSRTPLPVKASDIWSLGATVFEIVEGVTPFGEIGGGMQKGGAEIPEMQDVSPELQSLVESMLAKETWDRPTAEKVMQYARPHLNDTDTHKATKQEGIASISQGGKETQRFRSGSSDGQKTQRTGAAPARETERVDAPPVIKPLNLSFTPENLSVPAGGGTSVLYVFTNADNYQMFSPASWIHVHEKTDSRITLQFDENKTGETRAYSFTLKAQRGAESVGAVCHISQASLPKDNKWVKWLVGIVIAIVSIFGIRACVNHQNEVKAERARQERIRQERAAEERRQREIEEDKRSTTLSLSSNSISISADGDYKNFTVTSNRDWSISGSSSWILCTRDGNKVKISCDYNSSSSARDGFVDIKTANGAKSQRITIKQPGGSTKSPSAYITKITADHNITQNGQLGMLIHVHFSISYKFNQSLTVYAFFKYRDGELLKDYDKKYVNDGNVYVEQTVTPNYVHCEWKDLQIFMPYEQLDFTKGSLKSEPLRLDLGIWDNSKNKLIGEMKTFNFNVTY